jgi:hypothetical protein
VSTCRGDVGDRKAGSADRNGAAARGNPRQAGAEAEHFIEVIVARWEKLAGQTAARVPNARRARGEAPDVREA